jgi:hypothetical protein
MGQTNGPPSEKPEAIDTPGCNRVDSLPPRSSQAGLGCFAPLTVRNTDIQAGNGAFGICAVALRDPANPDGVRTRR